MPRLRHANGGETRQAGVLGQRKTHGDRGRACRRLPAVWGEGSQGRRWAVDCRACGKLKAAPKPPNDEHPGCQVRKERRLTIPLPRCPRSSASSRTPASAPPAATPGTKSCSGDLRRYEYLLLPASDGPAADARPRLRASMARGHDCVEPMSMRSLTFGMPSGTRMLML